MGDTQPARAKFALRDGTRLQWHDWPANRPRARLLAVHGLGEHAGRYARLAAGLNALGVSVRGFDLRGHGLSGGRRGVVPAGDAVLSRDLLDVFAAYAAEADDAPFVLGHSLGGLIALHATLALGLKPRGLIVSSPALATWASGLDRALARTLLRVLPDLAVSNRLKTGRLSHNPAVEPAYLADPFVHDRISARVAQYIFESGPKTVALAPTLAVPTLLQIAGSDELVDPAGARRFATLAPSAQLVAREYPTLYHEIYNEAEPGRGEALRDLGEWLRPRLQERAPVRDRNA
jgi:alpha-beta hydrolase superfamily lysophospholipase